MESISDLKNIINSAPECATIIDIEEDGYVDYLYLDYSASSGEMIKSCCTDRDAAIEYSQGNIRSLSDIKRIIELMEAVNSLPDKLETDKWLKGLDRPTEFAISQAKSFAIGSVFDSIRKVKGLL